MRTQTAITIRIPNDQVPALDKLAERVGKSRPELLREAVASLLHTHETTQLIQQSAHAAISEATDRFRAEAKAVLAQQIEASRAADKTNRDLIARFIEALSQIVTPAKR
ncbi:ribbon-helix-helix protein, CopG family [Rhodanobacter sp. FW102-FHT14D06]|uniref:Ribbon-helix-helix protein, CopG family n=2 Tax=unclassified Rhodanobacter TaxID=2621553 RepID=A0AB74URM4_9GAMM